ncbi:gamma-aminobutyric acid receptor subunit beta-like [Galendromus occidentalis]|uniref:Gamma-aminobutyric acid receptor subunit beta-like n=1 Tax=Galendromus occidentalis TaxID=34638 RepID=A0AAJ7SDV9_9ACAR|nr:gamma-aminobutyric acid receptor subunit beta-like [Galendromus occidentalis]
MAFSLLILLLLCEATSSNSIREGEEQLRQRILELLKPTHVLDLARGTLNVSVDIIVDSVTDLKILRMEFEVRLRLFLTWELNDDTLEICYLEAESAGASRLSVDQGHVVLATDDVYFEEAKLITVPSETVRPVGVRYYRDERTSRYYKEFSGTFVVSVGCNLDLTRFPFDEQLCPLTIRSFSHRNYEVGIYPRGLVVDEDLELSEYTLTIRMSSQEIQHPSWGSRGGGLELILETCSSRLSARDGVFQGVQLSFRFARRLPHQFLIMYLPSLIIVGVASLSWLLPLSASIERLTLIITVTLVMYTQLGKIRSSVPTTSYVTFGDIWIFACTLFVFGVTVECSVMEGLYERQKRKENKNVRMAPQGR